MSLCKLAAITTAFSPCFTFGQIAEVLDNGKIGNLTPFFSCSNLFDYCSAFPVLSFISWLFLLIKEVDGEIQEKKYSSLKAISDDLNIEVHLIRRIYQCTGQQEKQKHQKRYKDVFEHLKIYPIGLNINEINL